MTITRTQLYAQVWEAPITTLARRYGLSNVGLAKICRRHDVPIPPRGYWAKRYAGKKPRPIPLPTPHRDTPIDLPDPRERTPISSELAAEVAKGKAADAPIRVTGQLRNPHVLVGRASQELQSSTVDDTGLLVLPADAALDVRVAKASLRRALLIMDAVLKALEQRGYRVSAGPKVDLLGVSLRFGIAESLDVVREEPKEHNLDGRYTFGHSHFENRCMPSGRLTIRIEHGQAYWNPGCRHTWRDGTNKTLEARLDTFVSGMVELASQLKARNEEQERRAQERHADEQRRQEAARLQAQTLERAKAEEARVHELIRLADNWRTGQILRAFIDAAQHVHQDAQGTVTPGSDFEHWVQWATQEADRLDPFKEALEPGPGENSAAEEWQRGEDPRRQP